MLVIEKTRDFTHSSLKNVGTIKNKKVLVSPYLRLKTKLTVAASCVKPFIFQLSRGHSVALLYIISNSVSKKVHFLEIYSRLLVS